MYYILDNDKYPVEATLDAVSEWQKTNGVVVKQEKTKNWYVSTVFLTINHCYDGGTPILFETMVFPLDGVGNVASFLEEECQRYTSYQDALFGHQKMVEKYETRRIESNP